MSFKSRTFLICFIVCWPLCGFLLYYAGILDRFYSAVLHTDPIGIRGFLFYAVGGLVMSFVITIVSFLVSPGVRAQNAIETEKEKNGYSYRYIELTEKELARRVKNGSKLNTPIYMNYLFGLTNAYLVNRNPLAARDVINRVSPEAIKQYTKLTDPAAMLRLLSYFDCQMAVCEELKDYDRLERVFQDAKPYIDRAYKKMGLGADLIIAEMSCTYTIMNGFYDEAFMYANEMVNQKARAAKCVGYMLLSRVYRSMGDFANAYAALNELDQLSKSQTEKMFARYAREDVKKAEDEYAQNIL